MRDYKTIEKICEVICISAILISIAFLLVLAIGGSCANKKEKKRMIENPPSINWLEEDLELYFFSTGLDVIKYETSDTDEIENEMWLFGVVREIETEKYYMFAYKLEDCGSIFNPHYVWKFSHKHEVTKGKLEHDLWS